MSHTQDPPRAFFFRCRNPLKILFPKNNNARVSPDLLSLLNNFETNLTLSIKELIPKDDDVLTVSWMHQAMHSLCETHQRIRTLVTELDLPVSDVEESLIYMYADISLKLLELCNAFTSELDRLNHGNLLLKFAFSKKPDEFSLSHLDCWRQHMMASKNPRIENCGSVLSSLVESMNHHHSLYKKVKKSAKGKVLLRALYGVKVKTLYIFSVFAAAFSGSCKNLLYITMEKDMEEVHWGQAFMELQNRINTEIKNMFLSDGFTVIKDVEAVESGVNKIYRAVQEGSVPSLLVVEALKQSVIELSDRFDLVSEETRLLSKTVISARDVMLERLWTKYEDEVGVRLPMIMSVKTCLCE